MENANIAQKTSEPHRVQMVCVRNHTHTHTHTHPKNTVRWVKEKVKIEKFGKKLYAA